MEEKKEQSNPEAHSQVFLSNPAELWTVIAFALVVLA